MTRQERVEINLRLLTGDKRQAAQGEVSLRVAGVDGVDHPIVHREHRRVHGRQDIRSTFEGPRGVDRSDRNGRQAS